MSDWRSRAKPADWRSRAQSAESNDSDPIEPPPEPSLGDRLGGAIGEALRPESVSGAFAHGASQGASLGFGDEVMSAFAAGADQDARRDELVERVADAKRRGTYDPSAAAPEIPGVTSYQLKRPGQPTLMKTAVARSPQDNGSAPVPSWLDDYRRNRSSFQADLDTAQKEHSGAYLGGELLGAIALPVPGANAKGMAKAAAYAKQGAKIGAASGLGHSRADLTEGEVGRAFIDTLVGGATGYALGGALGYGAGKLDPWLQKIAQKRAYQALDPELEAVRRELGEGATSDAVAEEARRLGKRALDEGIIPEGKLGRWASAETLADRAKQAKDAAGALKGGFVNTAQDAIGGRPVDPENIALAIEREALRAQESGAGQDTARALMREVEAIRKAGVGRALAGKDPRFTLPEAEAEKTLMQQGVYKVGKALQGGPREEAKRIAARVAKRATEDAIESGLGPEDLEQFVAVKNRFGDLAQLVEAAGSPKADHGVMHALTNHGGWAALGAALAKGRAAPAAARTLQNVAETNYSTAPAVDGLQAYLDLLRDTKPK